MECIYVILSDYRKEEGDSLIVFLIDPCRLFCFLTFICLIWFCKFIFTMQFS